VPGPTCIHSISRWLRADVRSGLCGRHLVYWGKCCADWFFRPNERLESGTIDKLASLSFDAAGFGHSKPIVGDASTRFRNRWGEKSAA